MGGRPVVRPGDPGVDARWLRRRAFGIAVATGWLVAWILAVGVMTALRIGPPGWIEAWQLRDHGTANPLIAALPFLPLAFLPRLVGLLPVAAGRPFLLGMQQAWKPEVGPRVLWPTGSLRRRTRTVHHVALGTLLMGLAGMVAGATWAWTEASKPSSPAVPLSYASVAAGRVSRGLVAITGAREGNATWIESTHLRTTTVRDEWRDVRPGATSAPTALVERIAVDVDTDGRLRAFARPGLIGRVSPLDDWHVDLLRREGFVLADHAWVLNRSISARTDGMEHADGGMIVGLLGLVAAFLGGLFAIKTGQRLAALTSHAADTGGRP